MKRHSFLILLIVLFGLAPAVADEAGPSISPELVVELADDIALDDSQVKAIGELVDGAKRDAIRLRAEVELVKLDLKNEMRKKEPRKEQVSSLVDTIGSMEAQLRKNRLLAWLGVRELLRPEQRKQLTRRVRELRAMKRKSPPETQTSAAPQVTMPKPPDAKESSQPARKKKRPPGVSKWGGGRAELEIRSPNVFGEVWVNQRRVGYPPIVAKNLGSGTAVVEVRVQDKVWRTRKVLLSDGFRSKLVLLSTESALYFGPEREGSRTVPRARRIKLEQQLRAGAPVSRLGK